MLLIIFLFSDTHKIGISYEGFPIFFIASSNISSLSNIKLDLISIQFNQLCRLKLSNTDKPIENYYTNPLVELKS